MNNFKDKSFTFFSNAYSANIEELEIILGTLFKNSEDVNKNMINIEDIYAYLAILLILNINNVPNVKYCRNKDKKFSYNIKIAAIMHFDHFQFINKHITCISGNDVNEIKIKKCFKIVEAIECLSKRLYIPREYLSIDKGMMAYKVKMENRVYYPIKPDKWGIKFYILAEATYVFVCNLKIVGEQSKLDENVISLCKHLVGDNRKLLKTIFITI
ncbi:hypothetical protein DMUE_2894 [Dictyocoela muelleri]|nr:hypothetical protein DMUE_2894 [Dictyocoela muelleri]